jgi:hypothetical protein
MGRGHRRAARRARADKLPDQAVSLLASVLEERKQLRAQHARERRRTRRHSAALTRSTSRIAEPDGDALD